MEEQFENYKEGFLDNLKTLISFKSYLKKINNYPNKEQLNALKFMINLGEKEGFKTYFHPKGYYGYIEYGKGKKMVGILGHIDVVDPGDLKKWKSNPFEMKIEGNYLIGRGTIDDKGPMMLSFYVLKALKDSKIKLNKRIRLILGTDEETLWRGINKYIENEEKPEMGFSPDATFPAIYGEKGLLQWKVEEKLNNPNFKIYGGSSVNAVPDKAIYQGDNIKKIEENIKKYDFEYKKIGKNEIELIGKSEHAMLADKGKNAITRLCICVNEFVDSKLINFIANEVDLEAKGKKLFDKEIKDKETGSITLNIGKLGFKNNILTAWFDNRLPITITLKEIEKLITEKLKKYNLKYERFDWLKSIYADKDSFVIKTLMNSYKKITNKNDKPYISGGATFARSMDNIFAFGPFDDSEINLEHQPNEKINIKLFEKAFYIYVDALKDLAK
ncbi:MAG: peptidase [Candidatus Hepatoplasma vulgare]|nr:MAG: peptidase [Candidatus Hepatoplasma sp.]